MTYADGNGGGGALHAAEVLYKENLTSIRALQQRMLTVTLQVATLDAVATAAAVTGGRRLTDFGRVLACLVILVLHGAILYWLNDQRHGQRRRYAAMRLAHEMLRRCLPDDLRPAPVPESHHETTAHLLFAVLATAGLTALLATVFPGALAT